MLCYQCLYTFSLRLPKCGWSWRQHLKSCWPPGLPGGSHEVIVPSRSRPRNLDSTSAKEHQQGLKALKCTVNIIPFKMRLNRDMGLKCPENESTELMQKLRFLLNYSSRLGSSWSTTKVSLTTPSRVEQQVVYDVASRRSGIAIACCSHAKHLLGAGRAHRPRPKMRSVRFHEKASRTSYRNATCLQTVRRRLGP